MQSSNNTPSAGTTGRNRLILFGLWLLLYASFTLFTPPLLDDADSVHAEVAREILLRHDWVTLHANGIRYLEKAPLLYWSMAASFKLFGVHTFAARIPLALTVLALAFVLEGFGGRAFRSARAGFYAALIALSSFGIFIFTRITIPDVDVCLWLALALYAYWLSERTSSSQTRDEVGAPSFAGTTRGPESTAAVVPPSRLLCYAFATCCALNVLTKGLIGIVFPVGIVLAHLLLTRGLRGTLGRIFQFHLFSSILVFFAIAAPWHILIALANPTQGHPGGLTFTEGHWQVPLPTDGNVHGWTWFYFVNEHLLRYLNLRVPRDYDTVPLLLFWGLLFVWIMPWSAFLFHALGRLPFRKVALRSPLTSRESTLLLLFLWAAVPLLFFSLSTRQEYYVLPSVPALALLIAAWLSEEAAEPAPNPQRIAGQRISVVLLVLGSVAAMAAAFLAFHAKQPAPDTDLASLLQQNPADYALSFGHFLDLNAQAMGAFRQPLLLTAAALFAGSLGNWFARRRNKVHVGNLCLAAAAAGFLLAAHMGLRIFSPVLTSQALAAALAANGNDPSNIIVIHGEYEAASTLGFYLKRDDLHLLNGRSSNLWYGSFFPDAPPIFEDETSLGLKWAGTRRVFLWQDLSQPLPLLPGKVFLIAKSGGKEILSNQKAIGQAFSPRLLTSP